MTRADPFATFQLWVYRIGGFLVLNVWDDPAWLAVMFCWPGSRRSSANMEKSHGGIVRVSWRRADQDIPQRR